MTFEIGSRRWYDVPLTDAEIIGAERELTLYAGPAVSPGFAVRIDHLEVYSMTKSAFGWDAKTAAAAANARGKNGGVPGGGDGEDGLEGKTSTTRMERFARRLSRRRDRGRDDDGDEALLTERTLRTALSLLARSAAAVATSPIRLSRHTPEA